MAHGCGVCGRLHVHWYPNSWNSEALRQTDATTGAARPCPAVGIGLGTHCPVNTCIAAYARLGLALYRIAMYPRSLHSIESLSAHMRPWRTRNFGFPALNCLHLICLLMLCLLPCDCCAACPCSASQYMTLTILPGHLVLSTALWPRLKSCVSLASPALHIV